MISTIGANTQQTTLQETIQLWKDRIVCHPPIGIGYAAYIINSDNGERIKYVEANCDSLRHNATNYDRLLLDIKAKYTGIYKEALLNTIKYEATRRAFKTQHQWIHNSYQLLIKELKNNDIDRQFIGQIERLNKLIALRDRELDKLKAQCQGGLRELQSQYEKLQLQLKREQKRRQSLGKSNQSLAAYKGHFKRAQHKITVLKEENKHLKQEISSLTRKVDRRASKNF
jgi:DNA repair exonuclease SbcCD ATPase subunit